MAKKHNIIQQAITPTALKEGEDYYIENGFWVFTAQHHLRRGHCCESGCRHCPYGFKNKKA